MRFRLALLTFLMATPAFAQNGVGGPGTPPPAEVSAPAETVVQPAPAPPAGARFYLELDSNDLTQISAALIELPKRIADPLILKLNAQLQHQSDIVASKESYEKAKKSKK